MTPDAAHRIGAQPPRIDFPRQMGGVGGGTFGTNEVELRSFSIGGVAISWRRVLVAPIKMSSSLGALDGVLGTDVLGDFDIDLDLPITAWCSTPNNPRRMRHRTGSEPYARISASRSLSDHLFFPVRLDGRRIDALFDTGSQLSVLSSATALALGVSKAALAKDRPMITQGAAAERLSSHLHQFSQLEIGDEVVRHPEFVVTDIKLSDADLVLGINFLITRRVWFSTDQSRYFYRTGTSSPKGSKIPPPKAGNSVPALHKSAPRPEPLTGQSLPRKYGFRFSFDAGALCLQVQ